jgi:hypothetical protein
MGILDQTSGQHIQNRVEVHILQGLHVKHLIAGSEEASNDNAKQASQSKDPGIPSFSSSGLVLSSEFLQFLCRDDADLFGCRCAFSGVFRS